MRRFIENICFFNKKGCKTPWDSQPFVIYESLIRQVSA